LKRMRCVVLLLMLASGGVVVRAQDGGTPMNVRQPGELTAEQQAEFATAQKSFAAGQYAEALPVLKTLHEKHPRNAFVAKYAAEAAINTGDYAYAEANLAPLAASGEDWQALLLLSHCYAQEGKDVERDAALDRLTKMRATTKDPQFGRMSQFVVETVPTSKGSLQIVWSLVPVSGYNVYEMGRVLDPQGRRVFLISLESSDFEQPGWAKKHPDLAAAGQRFFSLDGYRDDPQPNGPTTQTHFTFAFYEDGRPDYKTVKAAMVEIAEGKGRAMSSRSGLPIPK